MGVPSLYRWLTSKYPEIKINLSPRSPKPVDNLYLDFNAIIHPCCNKGLNSMHLTEKQLYLNLIAYVDRVMKMVLPRKLLFISIDGVCPRAKMNQQRARRFVKAKESSEQGEAYFDDDGSSKLFENESVAAADTEDGKKMAFDVNSISPGTKFMDRLDVFIREMIKAKISLDPLLKNINVIYSSYKVPGEGEQKIMEYIRKHQSPKSSHMIYSPDADLIFLGLSLFDYNVFIMREEPPRLRQGEGQGDAATSNGNERSSTSEIVNNDYESKDFVLVDIQRLKFILINNFRQIIKGNFDYRRFLEDWVFLCFTIGNDFLPSASCFEIRTNAIDKLSSILVAVFLRKRQFITNRGSINFDILREFFIECANREDEYLVEKNRNLFISRTRMNLPYSPEEEFPMNSQEGKIRFYKEKMGISSSDELIVACKEYIIGLFWIYKYYFYGLPSWGWYYPYHFAPFMADLACVSNIEVNFNLGKPLRAMEQLLAVLPPMSKGLVPECLRDIFGANADMYPTEFKIDPFQKCMEWQAIPILPFVDIDRITSFFRERQSKLAYEEADRNIIGYASLYSRKPQVFKKAQQLYEGQKACEVLESEEYTGKVFAVIDSDPLGVTIERFCFTYVNEAVALSFDPRTKIPLEKLLQKKNAN